ncbi:MAG TPA: NADH-quinone oxidoreductase subunit L, partial [Candidatus Bathyarchaeia archaeon]|nr:NADH-quinone oxidoreductase subunit L [Candidatus Bathyarchaeia archaeon]
MAALLWPIPVLPLAGFVVLAILGRTMPRRLVAMIGAGSVGVSAVLAVILAVHFLGSPPPDGAVTATFWTWFEAGGLKP